MAKHAKSKNNKKIILLNFLRFISIIILLVSIIYITKWLIDRNENKKLEEKVLEAIIVDNKENESNVDVKYEIDFKKLKQINNQVVGYLKVNGTNIEYPVVKAEDNNYYLKRNLDKKYNNGGWIFADYKNKFDGTDKNIVIYGHNMKDNSMFGSLKNILNEEWYNNEENYLISFITEKEEQKYQVFSIYKIKNEDYYINTEFKNNDEFINFTNTLKERSIKNFNIDVLEEDSILTLSTCANNNKYRVVLHAKKI